MNPWPVEAEVEEVAPAAARPRRPGRRRRSTATRDVRNVLERASARETAARVAAGAIAKGLPRARSASSVHSHVLQIASVARRRARPTSAPEDFAGVDESPVRCLDPEAERGDGRGDQPPAQGEREPRRQSSRCAPSASSPGSARTSPGRSASTGAWPRRVVSIQAVKGVSVGEAWEVAGRPARRPTTRSSGPRSAATTARPTTPAASRAGCRTASRSSSAAALKPISTLTKPLRSVDTETKEPAAGAARAHRLDRGPGGRRGRRGDGRAGARALLPREVRRRPHRRRARRRRRPTGSGSIGGAERRDAAPALVFIGFMGAGKSRRRSRAARDAGLEAIETDELLEARARDADRRVLRAPTARRSSARREAAGRRRAARERRRRRDRARRRQRALASGSARRSAATSSSGSGRRRGGLAAGRGQRPAAGASDRGRSSALLAERQPLYEELADAIVPAGDRRASSARALPALRALARAARAGPRMLWAASASGEYPVFVGRGPAAARLLAARGPPLLRHRHDGRRRSTPSAVEPLAGAVEVEPGERAKTLAEAERVLRELADAGMTRADHLVALGGGVVGDLAGFCAATYQRGVAGRPGADDAGRPGRLRLRRQDRGRPARGARTTSAPTTCRPRCSPTPATLATLPAEELAAGLRRGAEDGADRRRARSGSGCAALEELDPAELDDVVFACARTKLEVVAADERDAGRRAVLNLGHTVGHAIEAASGYARYRHGEAVGLGLLAALRLSGADELRDEVEALLDRHGLPTALDPAIERRRGARRRSSATRSATADGRRLRPARASRASRATGQRVDPDRVRAAVEELRRDEPTAHNRVEVLHGVNLDILGRRDPEHYGDAHADRAGDADQALRRASSTSRRPSSRPTTRASSSSTCTACPRSPTRAVLNAGRLDPLQLGDPRRARDRRPAGGRGPPLRRRVARGVAPPLGLRRAGARRRSRARGPTATARRSRC